MHTSSPIGRVRTLSFAALVLCVLVPSLAWAPLRAESQARTDYMIRILTTSEAFRVRAQAALSLGGVPPTPAVTTALIGALRDEEAAVRAAAAQSLGRVGDSTAIAPLQALARDPEAAVRTAATAAVTAIRGRSSAPPTTGPSTSGVTPPPSGPARFYVGVGDPGSPVAGIDRSLLSGARTFVVTRLGTTSGVVVAPAGESVSAANNVIRTRSLTGYFLDVSITALDTRADGAIHAAVSVVVQDYPGHNIRSMLSGSATASGVSGLSGQRAVVEAALGSALRGLTTALH